MHIRPKCPCERSVAIAYSSRYPTPDAGSKSTNVKAPLTRISSIRKAQAEIQPSPASGEGKRAAFTLAEVLITLGVIGVVAAMTMPALLSKIDDAVLRNQMKKSYSALYQAFNKTVYEMEFFECYYPQEQFNSSITSQCEEFYEKLAKNMKVIKYCPDNAVAKGCIKPLKQYDTGSGCMGYSKEKIEGSSPVWILSDGSSFIPYKVAPLTGALFLFDVNGKKGPNVGGKDIFPLMIFYHPKRGYYLSLGGCTGIVPYKYRSNLENFLIK